MKKAFYYEIPNNFDDSFDFSGFCAQRIDYLNGINDKKRRVQSYFVWKLLLHSLDLLKKTNELFYKDLLFSYSCNKWKCEGEKIFFSLSHSDNFVAVAISDEDELGIDVEKITDKMLKFKKFKEFKSGFDFTKEWVKRECDKKSKSSPFFTFKKIKDISNNEYVIGCNVNNIDFICVQCL